MATGRDLLPWLDCLPLPLDGQKPLDVGFTPVHVYAIGASDQLFRFCQAVTSYANPLRVDAGGDRVLTSVDASPKGDSARAPG